MSNPRWVINNCTHPRGVPPFSFSIPISPVHYDVELFGWVVVLGIPDIRSNQRDTNNDVAARLHTGRTDDGGVGVPVVEAFSMGLGIFPTLPAQQRCKSPQFFGQDLNRGGSKGRIIQCPREVVIRG